MPRVAKKSLTITEALSLENEGALQETNKIYEYITVSSAKVPDFINKVSGMAEKYGSLADQTNGPLQEFVKIQQGITEWLAELGRQVASTSKELSIIIRSIPVEDIVELHSSPIHPVQIFVQPDRAYNPLKALPVPKRKKSVSLAEIKVKEEGFILNGEYIRGMTKGSQVGGLFELFISKSLKEPLLYDTIDEKLNIEKGDYQARDVVLGNLKAILKNNKLELHLQRESAVKRYIAIAITKRIRKPKKKKKPTRTS